MGKRPNVHARKRRSESFSWLDSGGAEFLRNAGKCLAPAAGNRLLESGLGDKFAAQLLSCAVQVSDHQPEYWKLVAKFWTHDAWQRHLRNAAAKGEAPSPRGLSRPSLPPIVQALLGLYGRGALPWCLSTFLISTGKTAERIAQIITSEFKPKPIMEALGPALRKLDVDPEQRPHRLPERIAGLLSRMFSASSSRDSKPPTKASKSLTLSRANVAALIETLLSAKSPDNLVQGDILISALAETAWVEADEGLARALQQTPALRQAIRQQTQLGTEIRNRLGAIVQAVQSSAAKRQLEIEGDPGSEVEFDPAKHSHDDPRVKDAERIRLVTPTVFQGRGANRRVIRAADVEPA